MKQDNRGIVILLSKPALNFVREVRRRLDSDPTYLDSNTEELKNKVAEFLLNAGLLWDTVILTREAIPMLKEAIVQLRLIEK